MSKMGKCTFTDELASLINRHSIENESNTPDFILASYLRSCLIAFNKVTKARERWYGEYLATAKEEKG